MAKSRFSKSRRVALAGGAAVLLGGTAAVTVARASQAAQSVGYGAAEQSVSYAPGEHAFGISVFSESDGSPEEDVLIIAEHGAEPGKLKEHREKWLKAVADKLGVTPERLEQAMTEVAKEQGLPAMPVPPIGPMIAKPFPPDAKDVFTIKLDPGLSAAAKALGMTLEELKKEWPGKSLNDIAKARNVDPKVVADAIKTQRRADIDKAVNDKKLSAEMAERLKSHLDQEVEFLMQRGRPGLPGAQHPFFFVERTVRAPD